MFLDPVTGSRTIGVHKTEGGGGLRLLVIEIRLDWIGLLIGAFAVGVTTATVEDGKISLSWLDSNNGAVLVDGITTGTLGESFTSCNNSG